MIGGLKLKYPLRNLILEKIRETNTLTDSDSDEQLGEGGDTNYRVRRKQNFTRFRDIRVNTSELGV